MEVGQGVDRVTHKQFIEDWHKAMEDAQRLANQKMEKTAEYNKRTYDKKAKAVELVVGDQVLMKNVRERDGTQKMKSFWEETLFKVIAKRENIPVYRIQSVKNSADIRQIHRNLLMKCNELPIDVFDEKEIPKKKDFGKKKTGPGMGNGGRRSRQVPKPNVSDGSHNTQEDKVLSSEESSDEELAVLRTLPPAGLPETTINEEIEMPSETTVPVPVEEESVEEVDGHMDDVDASTEDLELEESIGVSDPEEFADDDLGSIEEQNGVEDTDDADSEDDAQSSSDSDTPLQRSSTRQRKQTRVFTYDRDGNAGWQSR